eukprot:COSAG01_NODE_42770_length_436_cov_6.154303_1_plen_24_part_10
MLHSHDEAKPRAVGGAAKGSRGAE